MLINFVQRTHTSWSQLKQTVKLQQICTIVFILSINVYYWSHLQLLAFLTVKSHRSPYFSMNSQMSIVLSSAIWLVMSFPLQVVNLRLQVVVFIGLSHLDPTKDDNRSNCSDVRIVNLQEGLSNQQYLSKKLFIDFQ